MRATPSERCASAPLLVLAALAATSLAGCVTRDVDGKPFHVQMTGATGASVVDGMTGLSFVEFAGTAHVVDPTTLDVAVAGPVQVTDPAANVTTPLDLGAAVRLRFDAAGLPDLRYPAQLEGAPVVVNVLVDPEGKGPKGEPDPVPAFRVATGTGTDLHLQFLLGEDTFTTQSGTASIPYPLFPFKQGDDLPIFEIVAGRVDFEPIGCGGLLVYDGLRVTGDDGQHTLRRGHRTQSTVGAGEPPWTVAHVESWHQDGGCSGEPPSFTQFAAWR